MDPLIDRFEDDEILDAQPLPWLWVERIIASASLILGLYELYVSYTSFRFYFTDNAFYSSSNRYMILVGGIAFLQSLLMASGGILMLLKKRIGYIFSQISIINLILNLLVMMFGSRISSPDMYSFIIVFLIILGIVEYLLFRPEIKEYYHLKKSHWYVIHLLAMTIAVVMYVFIRSPL